jgi:archaemetzincin
VIALTEPGSAADDLLPVLVPILERVFDTKVAVTAAVPLPQSSYNASRDQYLSSALLDALVERKQADWDRLLGIADVDLYVPSLNFVFGEADVQRGVAVFLFGAPSDTGSRHVQASRGN